MRNAFSQALTKLGKDCPETIFLTGDLGFNALEPVREAMNERFINMGVAEQNMISVAAGMAKTGLRPWCYSIAPFAVYRPFEQIRNDICYHNLPVTIVGNGGGFTYGAMGFTHHAIEDYGALSTLPNMRIFVPAFAEHVSEIVQELQNNNGPAYLRLGRATSFPECVQLPKYSAHTQLTPNAKVQVLVVGPMAVNIARAVTEAKLDASVWAINEPFAEINPVLKERFAENSPVLVVEEHVKFGSFASNLAVELSCEGIIPSQFRTIFANGNTSDRAGSEQYLRNLSGMDETSILRSIEDMLSDKNPVYAA